MTVDDSIQGDCVSNSSCDRYSKSDGSVQPVVNRQLEVCYVSKPIRWPETRLLPYLTYTRELAFCEKQSLPASYSPQRRVADATAASKVVLSIDNSNDAQVVPLIGTAAQNVRNWQTQYLVRNNDE